ARQTSTSSPTHLPWLSARAKPATPVGTPQISEPRDLMASTSLPARAAVETRRAAAPAAAANEALYMVASLLPSPAQVSPCEPKQATGQLRLRLGRATGAARPLRYRIGGAYCRPPWVHSRLSPRSILSGELMPRLRSKLSP